MNKGIVPIISILLMIMLTIAISSGLYFWFAKIQSSSQSNTEQYSEELLGSMITTLDVVDKPTYNTLAEEIECISSTLVFHLQNTGAQKINMDKSNIYLRIWDDNDKTICYTLIDNGCDDSRNRLFLSVYNEPFIGLLKVISGGIPSTSPPPETPQAPLP